MKYNFFSILIFVLFVACVSPQKGKQAEPVFQPKDKEILEQVLNAFSEEVNTPTSELIIKVGMFFKETPYVAHTLETEKEQLVINLRELDCTTYAENCLAISQTIKSKDHTFERFAKELQKVRYRNGKLNGYPSRLHYFSDWIYDNDKKKLTKSVSREIAQTPYPNKVNFMSTHPKSYKQLNDNAELVQIMAKQESKISAKDFFFIPEDKIASVENKLQEGDIVGITTGIEGLDISHVGILVRKNGRIHLMHASSAAEKVIISEGTLEEYLLNSKTATGVMVARPI